MEVRLKYINDFVQRHMAAFIKDSHFSEKDIEETGTLMMKLEWLRKYGEWNDSLRFSIK